MKFFFTLCSFFCVPLLTLLAPSWLQIQGVGPCWPVLWLVPFSLQSGSRWGVVSGLGLGLMLDSLTLSGASYLPSLSFLGLIWGRLGKKYRKIESPINLALLALSGNLIVSTSLWAQKLLSHSFLSIDWFNTWALHTLMAEMIMTGLIAPLLCSWLVFRQN